MPTPLLRPVAFLAKFFGQLGQAGPANAPAPDATVLMPDGLALSPIAREVVPGHIPGRTSAAELTSHVASAQLAGGAEPPPFTILQPDPTPFTEIVPPVGTPAANTPPFTVIEPPVATVPTVPVSYANPSQPTASPPPFTVIDPPVATPYGPPVNPNPSVPVSNDPAPPFTVITPPASTPYVPPVNPNPSVPPSSEPTPPFTVITPPVSTPYVPPSNPNPSVPPSSAPTPPYTIITPPVSVPVSTPPYTIITPPPSSTPYIPPSNPNPSEPPSSVPTPPPSTVPPPVSIPVPPPVSVPVPPPSSVPPPVSIPVPPPVSIPVPPPVSIPAPPPVSIPVPPPVSIPVPPPVSVPVPPPISHPVPPPVHPPFSLPPSHPPVYPPQNPFPPVYPPQNPFPPVYPPQYPFPPVYPPQNPFPPVYPPQNPFPPVYPPQNPFPPMYPPQNPYPPVQPPLFPPVGPFPPVNPYPPVFPPVQPFPPQNPCPPGQPPLFPPVQPGDPNAWRLPAGPWGMQMPTDPNAWRLPDGPWGMQLPPQRPCPAPVEPPCPEPHHPQPQPVEPPCPEPHHPQPQPVEPDCPDQPVTPPAPEPPAPQAGHEYWSVTGDPVIKTLGGKAETLNNAAGRYVLMESQDSSYLVEHEVVEEQGTAATRQDHRNGAFTQAVAVRQDGNTVVFRNQQSKTVRGASVNQLEINGQVVSLAELKQKGHLSLPHGGEVRWTAPAGAIKEGTIRVISARGDVLRIEDMGAFIDLYGTPAASRRPGELAGLAGALDAKGPGFYQRLGTAAGWSQIKRVAPDQNQDHHADAALLASWHARGAEDILTHAANPHAHVVKAGESVATIARDVLGDAAKWMEIVALNQASYPDLAQAPHLVEVGWTLRLP
ncbi:MAG: hypothetical protein JWM80_1478 [Cyanobacteria bacterium RYN_339]|nr:hypothetical protein [Cyanobacteria bacterium RYN_339]